MLEVKHQRQDLSRPGALDVVERLARGARDVELDRFVQPVDDLIHPLDLGDEFPVVGKERVERPRQHGLDDVTHAECFARCGGQRDRRAVEA